MIQLVGLVPLFPFIGFLINGIIRGKLFSKKLSGILGTSVVFLSFIVSLLIFFQICQKGVTLPQIVTLFDFITIGSLHIPFAFQIDQLSVLFILIITGVGTLIHLYSIHYMQEESPAAYSRYFAYLNLFVFFMLLLVLGANYVMIFIGWEGVGLCSYLLIGFWFHQSAYNHAAKKAFIMNRIGDLGFLLAIFFMIVQFGSVTFLDIFKQATTLPISHTALLIITLFLLLGATGKSAQIPLYTWLPDAMAGPTPASALIHAATMVTAGVYLVARTHILFSLSPYTQAIMAVIGIVTALLAASIALVQHDIKKVLAYSTVSQLGYMFLALGIGAYTAAIFHVLTHAFFKALLFLGAGSVIHALEGEQDMRKMGGLKRFMPITNWTFWIGCLAIAGIPGLAGFFSKDEILLHAYASNQLYYLLGLAGSVMTAFYIFRLYYMVFRGKYRGPVEIRARLHESSDLLLIPLTLLAMLSIIGGYIGLPAIVGLPHLLSRYLTPLFNQYGSMAGIEEIRVGHATEWFLLAISTLFIVVAIMLARRQYTLSTIVEEQSKPNFMLKVLENKWYVDEGYHKGIVLPIWTLARELKKWIEEKGIYRFTDKIGEQVQVVGGRLRLLQIGKVRWYVFAMVIGIIVFLIIGYSTKL